MFKPVDPEDRMEEVTLHLKKVAGSVGVLAGTVFMLTQFDFGSRSDLRPILQFAAFFLSFSLACGVASIAWHFAAIWLGKLNLRKVIGALADPQQFPTTTEAFIEAWWKNETVLDAFFSVFLLLCSFGIYFALQPLVDMVAPNAR